MRIKIDLVKYGKTSKIIYLNGNINIYFFYNFSLLIASYIKRLCEKEDYINDANNTDHICQYMRLYMVLRLCVRNSPMLWGVLAPFHLECNVAGSNVV